MKKIYKTILIKNFINTHNISPNAFCKLCNISYSSYKRILNQNGRVRIRNIFKITKILKVSISEFLMI